VTGLVTDVGILCGLYIRDLIVHRRVRKEGMWKLKIMVPLYLGFFTGGTLGMLALRHIPGTFALIIPAVTTAWIGVGFIVLRHIHNKQERIEAAAAALRAQKKREGGGEGTTEDEEGLLGDSDLSRRGTAEEIELHHPDDDEDDFEDFENPFARKPKQPASKRDR